MPEDTTETTTSDAAPTEEAQQVPPATQTFTQADLDRIVKERVGRERQKFADYDALKSKASEFEALEQASKTEQEKAIEAARAAGRAEMEPVALKYEVALDKGLPKALAVRLQGTNRAEMEADADELLKLQAPAAPVVPAAAPPAASPDLGQGRRAGSAGPSVQSGRDLYDRLFPKKQTQT